MIVQYPSLQAPAVARGRMRVQLKVAVQKAMFRVQPLGCCPRMLQAKP